MKKKMLVEFYDHEYLDNVISLLSGEYSAVTYVYFRYAGEPDKRERARLSAFVEKRFGFKPAFLEIPENTMDSALERFRSLTDAYDCDFDITGGSSVFIAAAGALQAELGRDRAGLHEYDVREGRRTFACPEAAARTAEEAGLTVTEVLQLRGIRVLEREQPIRYELKEELRGEILRLWNTIRKDLGAWNAFATLPAEVTETWSSLLVEKRLDAGEMHRFAAVKNLLDKLLRAKIIRDLDVERDHHGAFFRFRLEVHESARFLYEMGGNLLELLTYLAVEDSGVFADCCTGVELDWDDRGAYGLADPSNELDVVMTRGHIPYFVSCKNTVVKKEFLYEIATMARHFGGTYAVPVMISTAKNSEAICARAREMGVVLIDRVRELTAEQFEQRLCAALHGGAARA